MSEKEVYTIDKIRWLILFGCFVFFHAFFTQFNFEYSLGYVASSFIFGFVVSALIWIFKRQWRWYDWLNIGSYIGICLFLLNMILTPILKDYLGKSSLSQLSPNPSFPLNKGVFEQNKIPVPGQLEKPKAEAPSQQPSLQETADNTLAEIQTRLSSLKYLNDYELGVFGKTTKQAIIAFQKDQKIYADGVPSRDLLQHLIAVRGAANARLLEGMRFGE